MGQLWSLSQRRSDLWTARMRNVFKSEVGEDDYFARRQLCWFNYSAKPMASKPISNTMLVGNLERFWEVDEIAQNPNASPILSVNYSETKSIPEYKNSVASEDIKFGQLPQQIVLSSDEESYPTHPIF